MFEVLPGTGLSLPAGGGVLRAGASERVARWAVATVADVRSAWVCGAGWAFAARYEDLDLLAYGDCHDRQGVGEDQPGLATVVLSRNRDDLAGPSAVPVVLDGIDLFGHPASEVQDVLGRRPYPDIVLAAAEPGGYLPEVRFTAVPSARE
jgi:hypothetical protein